jgi:hypothetical protein
MFTLTTVCTGPQPCGGFSASGSPWLIMAWSTGCTPASFNSCIIIDASCGVSVEICIDFLLQSSFSFALSFLTSAGVPS